MLQARNIMIDIVLRQLLLASNVQNLIPKCLDKSINESFGESPGKNLESYQNQTFLNLSLWSVNKTLDSQDIRASNKYKQLQFELIYNRGSNIIDDEQFSRK